jgi:hypothetical protein
VVIIVGMYALGMTDGVAWQRDWESRSYVELIRHVADLQEIKIREAPKTKSQD